MKKTMRLISLLLAGCMLLAACAKEPEAPAETAYKVSVVNANNDPYTTGVVVRFLKDGQQAAMQVVGENGVAEKTLATGEYTVELTFTGNADDYYYDKTDLKLTAEKTELSIVLAEKTGEGVPLLYGSDGVTTYAYDVNVGSTYIELEDGRNYFLFTPQTPGLYKFTTTDATAAIGYYGAPHFVQENSAAEVVDNSFSISVRASMIGTNGTGTTVIVIGVDKGENANCILNVIRVGDPEHSIEDEPWMIYSAKTEPKPYTLPADAKIGEFDLTADSSKYDLVYNETDGYYHLDSADGPLVLVRLGQDSKYLACFKTILENSGVVKYFFNEDGSFQKKESYSECLLQYIENMDETNGVYPLTEDLKYIIQQRGDHSGWFDPEESLYLFKDTDGNNLPGINAEISWLFMCCYISG